MVDLPCGTVSFLFTDIEGSTPRWEREPAIMAALLAHHDACVRGAVERNRGVVFKTLGDGFWSAFSSPVDALEAAIEAQVELRSPPLPLDSDVQPLRVRMVVHTGVVESRGGDYFGPPLNTCARLLAAAQGGVVLLTAAAAELASGRLPAQVQLSNLGEHRLRGIARPVRVFSATAPGFPTADGPPMVAPAERHNLPVRLTSFVGRKDDLDAACRLVRQFRLVTLTGVGGVGKTRLAMAAAAAMLDDFEDGVWFVDLAPLRDPDGVPAAVAAALDVREEPGRPLLASLSAHVARRRMLLVLDNCEHLLDASAALADALRRGSETVHILATSRAPLCVDGEKLLHVQGMEQPKANEGQPGDLARLAGVEAVALFVERARAVRPDFQLDSDNAAAVAEICRRLDGLPLALELAAGRVGVLSVTQVIDRLDERFRLLTGGSRSVQPRQQALGAALDWSWDLLDDRQRLLLARLSVFPGDWTLDAAEAVCADDQLPASGILDLLAALVAHSLVGVGGLDQSPRYRLLETVRAYAAERLEQLGQTDTVRRRHAERTMELAAHAEPQLRGPQQAAWLDSIEGERENVRAALRYLRQERQADLGLRLTCALFVFWLTRAPSEGRSQLEALLDVANGSCDVALTAHAHYVAGVMSRHQDDLEAARRHAEQALAGAEATGDRMAMAGALNLLGILAYQLDRDAPTARRLHERALAIRKEAGNEREMAVSLFNLANIARDHDNDLLAAGDLLRQSLDVFRKVGDRGSAAAVERDLGTLADTQGDSALARHLLSTSLITYRELGDHANVADALVLLGGIALAEGDLTQAGLHFDEALTVAGQVESRGPAARALQGLGQVARSEGALDRAAALLNESLAIARRIGESGVLGDALAASGLLALRRGDLAAASGLLHESLAVRRSTGEIEPVADSLEGLAQLAEARGQAERAVTLVAAADALLAAKGASRPRIAAQSLEAMRARAVRAAGHGDAARAEARGRAMTIDQAAAYGLADDLPGSAGST